MSIKTEVDQIEKDTIELKVEVPAEEMAPYVKRAYHDIAQRVRIPGFRKGKVPKPVIDQMVGKEAVLEEALQAMVPHYYPKAIEAAKIEPVTTPQIDVVQIEDDKPLIFKAKIQIKPEVEIGSLDDLKIKAPKKMNIDKEIKKQLDDLRGKFSTLEVVKTKRGAKEGDFLLIDFEGFLNGKPFAGGQSTDYMLEIGSNTFIPGFEDKLIDAKAGTEIEVELTFPDAYQEAHLAGQDVVFKVSIGEIKTKKLPKLDDDFAKVVSKFETLDELKKDLNKGVVEASEAEEKNAIRMGALDKMVELTKVELPGGMVERRIDQMVDSFRDQGEKQSNTSFEDWLKTTGMGVADFRKTYSEKASQDLKTELTLEALLKAHNIEATPEDVDAEITRLAGDNDVEALKKEIDERDGLEFLQERLSMNKAIDFLVEKVKIEEKKKKGDAEDESSSDSN